MNIKNIEALIKNGESETLEFKTSTGSIRSACETLCAFLNGKGGTLIFGVNDKGKIIGQNVSDMTKQEIARELEKIYPYAEIDVIYYDVENDKKIIVFNIQGGVSKPYVYDDRAYIRNQSTTIRMSREQYEQFIFNRKPGTSSWERATANDVTIVDLDSNRISQIVNLSIKEQRISEIALFSNYEDVLKKLKLCVNNKITNAGVVLFCGNHEKQFIQSHIKLARFKGMDKKEFIDNKSVSGNIFDLYEVAMNFLQIYLPVSGKIEEGNPFRVDKLAIPYKALREAIVNALCHRDYSSPSGSISLAIYDDRVEISSTGCLPSTISLEELTKEHQSHPRNPLIASVLYSCKMIEQWGRGTQEMMEFCKEAGNPKPKFKELTGSFTVILPFKEPIGGYEEKTTELTLRQKEILRLLKQSDFNSAQVAEKLKDSPTVRTVQIDLVQLEKYGLVKREGKARAMLWKLKA